MEKIIFLGDSSQTNSALKAYQISYDAVIDEIYHLLNESALNRLNKTINLESSDKSDSLQDFLHYRNEYVIRSIKKKKNIENYYYEQSNIAENRCYRCFLTASLNFDDEKILVEELHQQLAKKVAPFTDSATSRNFKA